MYLKAKYWKSELRSNILSLASMHMASINFLRSNDYYESILGIDMDEEYRGILVNLFLIHSATVNQIIFGSWDAGY